MGEVGTCEYACNPGHSRGIRMTNFLHSDITQLEPTLRVVRSVCVKVSMHWTMIRDIKCFKSQHQDIHDFYFNGQTPQG